MNIELKVGTRININDECVGRITKVTDTHVFIKSDVFTGWATKEEIIASILLATDQTGMTGG